MDAMEGKKKQASNLKKATLGTRKIKGGKWEPISMKPLPRMEEKENTT